MVAPSDDPVLQEAVALFTEAFKSDPEKAAFAPGRVNLIGEHTDYNAVSGLFISFTLFLLPVRSSKESTLSTFFSLPS